MYLGEMLSKFIPEGRFKNILRQLFFYVMFNLSFGIYNFRFKGVNIRLRRLVLYQYEILPLFGYFKHYIPKRGDVIIDAGSSPGLFAIYCSKKVGSTGKVICFEPDEIMYNLLVSHLRLNRISNVVVLKKGLWDKDATLNLRSEGLGSRVSDNGLVERVQVVSLDNELKRRRIDRVDFVKMDVEGAEIEALNGCKETIKKYKPTFSIASYHIVGKENTSKRLEKIFRKYNYKTFTEFSKHLTTYASKK